MGLIQPLLVEAVADLVQDAEEGVAEVVLVEPGRDPAIARSDARAERMGGHVQPAALEVKADRGGHRLAKDLLPLARIETLEDRLARSLRGHGWYSTSSRLAPGRVGNRRDQGHKLALERLEENGQLGGPGPGLVVVEQRVV